MTSVVHVNAIPPHDDTKFLFNQSQEGLSNKFFSFDDWPLLEVVEDN